MGWRCSTCAHSIDGPRQGAQCNFYTTAYNAHLIDVLHQVHMRLQHFGLDFWGSLPGCQLEQSQEVFLYLSTLCRACLLTLLHVQDITAFLSVHHVNDWDWPPTLQDNLESVFWVLLWIALVYLNLSLCPWELHWFMAVTSGQKSNMGDFTQKNAVVSKLSDEDLFPNYPLLKQLLLDLARLFRNHSNTSSHGEHGPMASERLQNHDEVIGWFEHYLEQENWSTGERRICTHSDRFYVWDRWMLLWRLGIGEWCTALDMAVRMNVRLDCSNKTKWWWCNGVFVWSWQVLMSLSGTTVSSLLSLQARNAHLYLFGNGVTKRWQPISK